MKPSEMVHAATLLLIRASDRRDNRAHKLVWMLWRVEYLLRKRERKQGTSYNFGLRRAAA